MSEATVNSNISDENQTDICVVCFKNVEIYSIGECDHPVCYECSTRMRVLCQQNECPICRKSLSKVIFTNQKLKYRELEANNRSECYNKKYKIAFENPKIQNAFYTLLAHPCPMCNCPPFSNFDTLKDHVRKEHEHYYCTICIEHLKIFTFERKCYNRHDLAMHRRKGDADNTSHRGHPLCQYCDCRFLDRDELFRHLRKEHYFCHFCDADGSNEFYDDYDSLREHFRSEHYLCEEGDCVREQFTAVFRSDIDLKAHFASVHGKSLNKQQAKHARTLQLEIRLGHRGRASHSQQDNQPGANLLLRNSDSNDGNENQLQNHNKLRQTEIAPLNEQEFPSLGGISNNASTASSLLHPDMSNIRKSGPGGLARTKENFPALGHPVNDIGVKSSNNKNTPASAILKGSLNSRHNKRGTNGMVIHVSNRPNSSTGFKNKKDFPALPSHSKHSPNKSDEDDDSILNQEFKKINSLISAKHRSLVNNYQSVVHPTANLKIQTAQENNTKLKKNCENSEIKLTCNDFPALTSKSMNNTNQISWVKTQKQKEHENRQSKVAPAPLLPRKYEGKRPETEFYPNYDNHKKKGLKNNEEKKKTEPKSSKNSSKKSSEIDVKKQNSNDNKKQNKKSNSDTKIVNGIHNSCHISNQSENNTNSDSDKLKTVKPPPGFNSITLNSVAKPSASLTFITSSGKSYDIIPDNVYIPPPNGETRNQELTFYFRQALTSVEEFNEFRNISSEFRRGNLDAVGYFEECLNALKDKFDDIFPELLALLPDITKQQDLYLEYQQYIKKTPQKLKSHQKLEMCYFCKQILKSVDVDNHVNSHNLNSNFPKL